VILTRSGYNCRDLAKMATMMARLQAAVALLALLVAAAAGKAVPSVYVQIGVDVPAAIALRMSRELSKLLPSSLSQLTSTAIGVPRLCRGPRCAGPRRDGVAVADGDGGPADGSAAHGGRLAGAGVRQNGHDRRLHHRR